MNKVDRTANTITKRGKLLKIHMVEHQRGKDLAELKDNIIKLSWKHKQLFDILIDLSDVKSSDDAANKIARGFFDDLPFGRMGLYGGGTMVTVSTKLLLNFFAPAKGVRMFASEEKARAWLRGDSIKAKLRERMAEKIKARKPKKE